MTFKEWLTSSENEPEPQIQQPQQSVVSPRPDIQPVSQPVYVAEPWKASKKQVVQHWKSISPNTPLGLVKSIPFKHKGKTMNYDGVRVTGSANFINYVMSRIKDLTNYENKKTRLEVLFKQQVNKKLDAPVPDAYTFYAQVKQRPPH